MATSQDHKRLRRRTGLTPAAWARIRPRPWYARACTNASCARSSSRPSADCAKDGSPTRAFCTPGSWCTGWHAQRARVQLPLRRSGDAAHHDAAAKRPARAVRGRARRTTRHRSHAEWDPRAALGVVLAAESYRTRSAKARSSRARAGRASAGQGVPCRHTSTDKRGQVVTYGGAYPVRRRARGRCHRGPKAGLSRWWMPSTGPGMRYRQGIGYRAVAREARR